MNKVKIVAQSEFIEEEVIGEVNGMFVTFFEQSFIRVEKDNTYESEIEAVILDDFDINTQREPVKKIVHIKDFQY